MPRTETLPATTASHQAPTETVAIPIKHLPYLRFLSAILNKPLNDVARVFLAKTKK